jgi:hypothetical protein
VRGACIVTPLYLILLNLLVWVQCKRTRVPIRKIWVLIAWTEIIATPSVFACSYALFSTMG